MQNYCKNWNQVFLFGNDVDRTGHIRYFLPKVGIKDYKVLIDGQNFLDQPLKYIRIFDNIRKIGISQKMITQLLVK